jgi:hypothetical protein
MLRLAAPHALMPGPALTLEAASADRFLHALKVLQEHAVELLVSWRACTRWLAALAMRSPAMCFTLLENFSKVAGVSSGI